MERSVEQHASNFYSQPRDADEANSIRLLYDRWAVFFTKNERIGMCIMKIDEKKAGRAWIAT